MGAANEGKCLDAVLKVLEARHNAKRAILERDTPSSRGIELVCDIGGQRYALEHTLIEPFPDNQRDNITFERIFDDTFESEVRDQLKPHLAYTIAVDVYAFEGKSRKELGNIRQNLLSWLRTSIPELPEPEEFPQTSIFARPPKTPVRVRLACHRSQRLGGRLIAERFAPPALARLREQRLRKALNDKSPKLYAAKQPGTHTVLVLENNDIALTNESVVSETIRQLSREIAYMPDDIFLVGTYTAGYFYVTQVREDGRPCLQMGAGTGAWEFKSEVLTAI
jgi:hypothetical protein